MPTESTRSSLIVRSPLNDATEGLQPSPAHNAGPPLRERSHTFPKVIASNRRCQSVNANVCTTNANLGAGGKRDGATPGRAARRQPARGGAVLPRTIKL